MSSKPVQRSSAPSLVSHMKIKILYRLLSAKQKITGSDIESKLTYSCACQFFLNLGTPAEQSLSSPVASLHFLVVSAEAGSRYWKYSVAVRK